VAFHIQLDPLTRRLIDAKVAVAGIAADVHFGDEEALVSSRSV
jgi:hypothetical protein